MLTCAPYALRSAKSLHRPKHTKIMSGSLLNICLLYFGLALYYMWLGIGCFTFHVNVRSFSLFVARARCSSSIFSFSFSHYVPSLSAAIASNSTIIAQHFRCFSSLNECCSVFYFFFFLPFFFIFILLHCCFFFLL